MKVLINEIDLMDYEPKEIRDFVKECIADIDSASEERNIVHIYIVDDIISAAEKKLGNCAVKELYMKDLNKYGGFCAQKDNGEYYVFIKKDYDLDSFNRVLYHELYHLKNKMEHKRLFGGVKVEFSKQLLDEFLVMYHTNVKFPITNPHFCDEMVKLVNDIYSDWMKKENLMQFLYFYVEIMAYAAYINTIYGTDIYDKIEKKCAFKISVKKILKHLYRICVDIIECTSDELMKLSRDFEETAGTLCRIWIKVNSPRV